MYMSFGGTEEEEDKEGKIGCQLYCIMQVQMANKTLTERIMCVEDWCDGGIFITIRHHQLRFQFHLKNKI